MTKIKKGKLGFVVGAISFVLAIGTLGYVILVPSPVKVEIAKVSVGPFQETIRADGVLRSKERYTVTAPASGDMKRISLRVGDPVAKGAPLTDVIWDRYDVVRAPIKGVISKVYRESAGPINRGDPLVEIVDPTDLELMAELLTTDAVRLRVGADVWIDSWLKGNPIKAKLIRISKAGFTKQSALGVEEERTEVTAELVNPSGQVLENVGSMFHVDATFEVSAIKEAVKVPVGSLFRDGSDWAVFLVENRRAHKTKVEVGALGSQDAWIKSGLRVGQDVVVYPGDLVKEGTRLRVKDD